MSTPQPPFHFTVDHLLYAILQKLQNSPLSLSLIPVPPFHSTTNELLYAILQQILSLQAPVTFSGFNIYYVSSRYGNNATAQVNNILKPFKTITAAKSMYTSAQDLIHVLPGVYDEANLFGEYRYWFDYGSEINYSGAGAIFQQYFGNCLVRGYGKFKTSHPNASVVNIGNWIHCLLDMECDQLDSEGETIVLFQNTIVGNPLYKPHLIKANRAYSKSGNAVRFAFNSYAHLQIKEIISDSFTDGAVSLGNVNTGKLTDSMLIGNNYPAFRVFGAALEFTLRSCSLHTKHNDPSGHGIYIDNSLETLYLENTKIECTHPLAKAIQTLSSLKLYLDNNVQSNRDTASTALIEYLYKDRILHQSTTEVMIDITAQSSIDLSAYPNQTRFILSSSNPTEQINAIIGAASHHGYTLFPQAGLMLILLSTEPLSASAESLVLDDDILLNGSKGDWLSLYQGFGGTGNRKTAIGQY